MNIQRIHKAFISGRVPYIISIVVFLLFQFLGNNDFGNVILWATAAIQIGISFLLIYFTQSFVIIRSKTLLPGFFFLLFAGTETAFHYNLVGNIAALCVLLCFFFLFGAYQKKDSQVVGFNIALLLTLGSLLWSPLLFFFPLFWYGLFKYQSLNWRTFFASIIGFLTVYLFIFAWAVYSDDLTIFYNKLPKFDIALDLKLLHLSLREYILGGYLFILYILAGSIIFIAGISEKVKTLNTLSFLYISCFVIFIFSLLGTTWENQWILILYVPLSFLVAHFFTLTKRTGVMYLMLFTILVFLGSYIWQVYLPIK